MSDAPILLSTAFLLAYTSDIRVLLVAACLFVSSILRFYTIFVSKVTHENKGKDTYVTKNKIEDDFSVIDCIKNRQSVFPNYWNKKSPSPLDARIIQSLLDAALFGPFHGKCYAGQMHPARFVVLGRESHIEMQTMTLEYYDKEWKSHWNSLEDYKKWRDITEEEITGRWAPCEYMIAIVMRRQSGPKRLPEWEEAAAVAAAVQNMHIQSTKFQELGCYWSSWHSAARDSLEMKEFLNMEEEDKCMGFFMVAQRKRTFKDKRIRKRDLMNVEWRA